MTEEAGGRDPADLERIRTWDGERLDDVAGVAVGRLEGVLVDERDQSPYWLLARMGRFGHYTLVPSRDAVEGAGRIWIPYTRDLIRRAPRVEPGTELTAARERELLAHYGIVDPDRSARIEELDRSAVTARAHDS